jgi:hypothetical protein
MGTRADFYVGKNKDAKWIGSIAWDGYRSGIDENILKAKDENEYIYAVNKLLQPRDDASYPDNGWPWPWENSRLTDCSYWFFNDEVWEDMDGHYYPCNNPEINDVDEFESEGYEKIKYPNMSHVQKVTLGKRSGLITFSG